MSGIEIFCVFLFMSMFVSGLLLGMSFGLAVTEQSNIITLSGAYECGFMPFKDSRIEFDFNFYIIAILFLIFDVELMFLLPWAIGLSHMGYISLFVLIWVVILIIIGYVLELVNNTLEV